MCLHQGQLQVVAYRGHRMNAPMPHLVRRKAHSRVEVGGNTDSIELRETAALTSPSSSETNENWADKIHDAIPSCFV